MLFQFFAQFFILSRQASDFILQRLGRKIDHIFREARDDMLRAVPVVGFQRQGHQPLGLARIVGISMSRNL